MATIYIDNLHNQLYCQESGYDANLPPGSSEQTSIGLSDFGELPATAKWYIRKVVFSVKVFNDPVGLQPDTRFSILGGVSPRDLVAGTNFSELDDYQDINGFPLNGVRKLGMVQSLPQKNEFSWTKTYTPSKNLTLNREQDIVLCTKTLNGNDLFCYQTIMVHAERDM